MRGVTSKLRARSAVAMAMSARYSGEGVDVHRAVGEELEVVALHHDVDAARALAVRVPNDLQGRRIASA